MCHRSESTVNQYVTNRIPDPDHGSRIPDPGSRQSVYRSPGYPGRLSHTGIGADAGF
jgi:hypothetical protein